ncbi:hypothetical protein PMAYCL1PPCAC_18789, partial [Pristionchus mayeri]
SLSSLSLRPPLPPFLSLFIVSLSEMVSTTTSSSSTSSSHQYITDYVPSTGGKSPLAMLAKTCETIGLPETPAKKVRNVSSSSSPSEKKGSSPSGKKENTKTVSSPKGPITTTFPAALGFPPMASFPFMGFPGMPGAFPPMPSSMMATPSMMSMMGMKPPCPNIMMGRPCTQAGCPSCQPPSTSFDPMTQWMNSLNPAAYNAFLAAAAAAASTPSTSGPSFPLLPTSLSLPCTSTPSTSSSSSAPRSSSRSSSSTKSACMWVGCDKTFDTPEELSAHLTTHVPSTPSTPTPSEKTSPKMTSTPASHRFNPYAKPSSIPVPLSSMPSLPLMPMAMNPLLMSGFLSNMRLPLN